MPLTGLDEIVEERVAKLRDIAKHRNVLLRRMYYLMRRPDVGTILDEEESEDDDDEGLRVFLDRFDMNKNPDTGSIANLNMSYSQPFQSSTPPRRGHGAQNERSPRLNPRSQGRSTPKSPSVDEPPSPPIRVATRSTRRGKASSYADRHMDVDDGAESSRSVGPPRSRPHDEEIESDDILGLVPLPSPTPASTQRSSRVLSHAASVTPYHQDDDDERDELDLIGSASPSPSSVRLSPRSATFSEKKDVEMGYASEATGVDQENEDQGGQEEAPESRDVESHQMQVDVTHRIKESMERSRGSSEDGNGSVVSSEAEKPGRDVDHLASQDINMAGGGATTVKEERASEHSTLPKTEGTTPMTQCSLTSASPSARMFSEENRIASPATSFDTSRAHEGPLVPVVTANMVSRGEAPVILAPSSPATASLQYSFVLPTSRRESRPDSKHSLRRPNYAPEYTLPPLKSLPVEFNRRGKAGKPRKREKERDREKGSEGKKETKEEWVAMGVNRWNATIRANPVYKKVARATKCLTTREWEVAIQELRLIRAFDRIEHLKAAGRWSFRQPKKQRGVGALAKTHWDHLIDEMKWMRTDFREERKWKMVLAYDLAHSVLEWHAAGSTTERVRTRICVRWKRRRASDYAEVENEDVTQEDLRHVDSFGLDPMSMIEYGSEDEEEHDQDRQSVVDALEPGALIQDALNEAEAVKTAELDALQTTTELTLAPKVEDVEDASSLTRENIDAMDVDANEDPAGLPHGGTDIQDDAAIAGLKQTSTDPLLPDKSSSQSLFGDGEPLTSTTPATVKSSICTPLRRRIAYSDETKLFLDPDDLALDHDLAEMSLEERDVKPPSFDLNSIFPDLPTFGFSNTMTPVTADGRKKSDRKAEKDDPNKRSDDTTYTKLTPIGTFMHCKPTLISSLQPSKCWRSGRWLKAEEGAVSVEYEGPVLRPSEDITSDLFPGSYSYNQSFSIKDKEAKEAKDSRAHEKEGRKRILELYWTAEDDLCLKNLVEKYPKNWPLIAEFFNGSRVLISHDKRTPKDCEERWFARWGPETLAAGKIDRNSPGEGTPPPITTARPSVGQMTTRGVKRPHMNNLTTSSVHGSAADARRRRRYNALQDAIRKAGKKREAALKSSQSQRKPSVIHDTHAQYMKLPKVSPQDLSRAKNEKEQQDMQLARRRHEELQRQQLAAREQAHRMGSTPNLPAQMLPQQPNGAARTPGATLPSTQAVPQIRSQVNISQQQRIPTPLAPGNARLQQQQHLLQAAHARVMVQAQAQAQAQALAQAHTQGQHIQTHPHVPGQAQPAPAQASTLNGAANAHLSPPYATRGSSSSPGIQHTSPPRSAGTPSNANHPPRPPSAQQQGTAMASAAQATGSTMPRSSTSMNPYFPGVQMTPELMQAMRVQSLLQVQQANQSIPFSHPS